jgi:hypothetical protein
MGYVEGYLEFSKNNDLIRSKNILDNENFLLTTNESNQFSISDLYQDDLIRVVVSIDGSKETVGVYIGKNFDILAKTIEGDD